MQNIIKIPFINPIKYNLIDPEQLPQYFSKNMEDYPFVESIRPYQEKVVFWQPWGTVDSIRQQIFTNLGPVNIQVLDCEGNILLTDTFQQKQEDANNPTLFRYDSDLDLSPFAAMPFFIQLSFNGQQLLISEPQIILSDLSDTLLVEYFNTKFYEDTIFEDGFRPNIRSWAQLIYKEPGSEFLVYEDDPLDVQMIDQKNFDDWTLLIFGPEGGPDYLIKKINRILGCDNLRIDGKSYTRAPGSKLEFNEIEYYPMRGWRIDLREKFNRRSKFFEVNGDPNGRIALLANVESKGFIKDDAGGSFFQIIEVE